MPYESRFHVVLYQPEIPQNTGNIGRTCVAVRTKLWLVRPLGFQLDEHHVKRAGLDYWQHLNLQVVEDWPELLSQRGNASNFWYFSKFGRRTLWDAKFAEGDTLVFGSESSGLPSDIRDAHPSRCLTLPMETPVRSLNLANTVAAVLYEAWRQCGGPLPDRGDDTP